MVNMNYQLLIYIFHKSPPKVELLFQIDTCNVNVSILDNKNGFLSFSYKLSFSQAFVM